jgi:YD repeat-containing protein
MKGKLLNSFVLTALWLAVYFIGRAASQGATQYVYDEKGRLQAVIAPSGETAAYNYDAAGNLVSITRRSKPLVSPAGPTVCAISPGASPDAPAAIAAKKTIARKIAVRARINLCLCF